jgi:hypothetical protein
MSGSLASALIRLAVVIHRSDEARRKLAATRSGLEPGDPIFHTQMRRDHVPLRMMQARQHRNGVKVVGERLYLQRTASQDSRILVFQRRGCRGNLRPSTSSRLRVLRFVGPPKPSAKVASGIRAFVVSLSNHEPKVETRLMTDG